VKIIAFVEAMPQCGCSVPEKTLDRLAFLEKVIIAMMSGGILYNLYFFNDPVFSSQANGSGSILLFSGYQLFVFLAFAVYLLFALNAKDFSKTLSKTCITASTKYSSYTWGNHSLPNNCADKWEKTALYIQAIYYAIAVAFIIFAALILLTVGTMKMSSSFGKVSFLSLFSIVAVSAWSLFGGDLNVFLDYVMNNVAQIDGFATTSCAGGTIKSDKCVCPKGMNAQSRSPNGSRNMQYECECDYYTKKDNQSGLCVCAGGSVLKSGKCQCPDGEEWIYRDDKCKKK